MSDENNQAMLSVIPDDAPLPEGLRWVEDDAPPNSEFITQYIHYWTELKNDGNGMTGALGWDVCYRHGVAKGYKGDWLDFHVDCMQSMQGAVIDYQDELREMRSE